MTKKRRARRRTLFEELMRIRTDLPDPWKAIEEGRVLASGRIVTNPRSLIEPGAPITVQPRRALRGEAKLRSALRRFDVAVAGRVALDAGAAAGGFTTVLLGAGARRVYAVDAGHGQLLGSLRQDPRVINLERTNLAELDHRVVPDRVEVITLDLSYVAVARAAEDLERVAIAANADLIALVKPMFELGAARAPTDRASLDEALRRAVSGIERQAWAVTRWIESPVRGARGAIEFLLHASRTGKD